MRSFEQAPDAVWRCVGDEVGQQASQTLREILFCGIKEANELAQPVSANAKDSVKVSVALTRTLAYTECDRNGLECDAVRVCDSAGRCGLTIKDPGRHK